MDYSIERIADYACHVGEGPLWHDEQHCLYWLDITRGRIFRYDPRSEQAQRFFEVDVVGGMTLNEDGGLLLFMEAGRIALLKDGLLTTVVDGIDEEAGKRFNDVIATPSGSVFCGTLAYAEGGAGSLYQLRRDRTLQKVIEDTGIANGMGFSPDLTHFYFTDSTPARKIYRYDYDRERDAIHGQTVFAHVSQEHGVPDGLTVDVEGYVWSACWDGGKLRRYAPSGEVDSEIAIPGAKKVSSVIFGGAAYTDLYVTTAGGHDKSENGEHAGALFRIRSDDFQGRPEYRSQIAIP